MLRLMVVLAMLYASIGCGGSGTAPQVASLHPTLATQAFDIPSWTLGAVLPSGGSFPANSSTAIVYSIENPSTGIKTVTSGPFGRSLYHAWSITQLDGGYRAFRHLNDPLGAVTITFAPGETKSVIMIIWSQIQQESFGPTPPGTYEITAQSDIPGVADISLIVHVTAPAANG